MKSIAVLFCAAVLSAGAAHAQTAPAAPPAAAPADPAQFLATNAKAPGVVVLPSGLQYKVVESGPAGPSPKEGDIIKVQYEGTLLSGKVFDSTPAGKSAMMPLGDLIPAWMEALPKMHVGDEWMIYVPPSLGYGERGIGPIPPGSALIFKIKLTGMLSTEDVAR